MTFAPRTQKTLLAIGLACIVSLLGYGLYYLFFKPKAVKISIVEQLGPLGSLPRAGEGAPTAGVAIISDELPSAAERESEIPSFPSPIPSAQPPRFTVLSDSSLGTISADPSGQGVRMYNNEDGKFYRLADDGTPILLSLQTFYNVKNVTWGASDDRAIIEYPDGTKTFNDFKTGRQATLPSHWEDLTFSPNGEQIAAKSVGEDESNRFLVIANPDGTGAKAIEEMGRNQDKVHVSWSPNNQIVAYSFTGDPMGVDQDSIVLLGKNRENFKNLLVEGRGFTPVWSPSGDLLLYSVWNSASDFRPTLWVSGANGDQINAGRRNFPIATWADKCEWKDEATIICGVPINPQPRAGLQREMFDIGPDAIYRIDIRTGRAINLGAFTGSVVKQITVSNDGKVAFITDKTNGQIIRLEL